MQVEKENELNEDDDWEYAEGPAEIIWQGNEIIVKKKRVRIAKKDVDQHSRKEVLLRLFQLYVWLLPRLSSGVCTSLSCGKFEM